MTDAEAPPLRPWQIWGRFMKGCGNTIHKGDKPWDCEECLGPMLEALNRSFAYWSPKGDPWHNDPGDELDLRILLDNERTAAVGMRTELASLRAQMSAQAMGARAAAQTFINAIQTNEMASGQKVQALEDEIAMLKRRLADQEKT